MYHDIYVKEVFVSLFSIWYGLRTRKIILIINQWLKILWPIHYSPITHWTLYIINDLSADYPLITCWLLIDFIDVIDLLRLETMISFAQPIRKMNKKGALACENSRFSLLIAAGDVSQGGTSVTQWQKFHTDDVKLFQNPVISADWTME